ncbi:MAG: autotransporter-associated beta strand repeat-containing protein, partial [Verrucomicrobia bacterium]|nr:autotransporter-associated beta strand repeat-containing protein [Verrucomicrobiota bacterium]
YYYWVRATNSTSTSQSDWSSADSGRAGNAVVRFSSFDGTTNDNWSWVGSPGSATVAVGDDAITGKTGKYVLKLAGSVGGDQDPSLLFDNFDLQTYSNIAFSIGYAATGVDAGDDLWLDLSYDNGATWAVVTQLVDGFSGYNVNFGATGTPERTVSANPYVFTVPDGTAQVRVRVRYDEADASDNRYDEYYLDDIKLIAQGSLPIVYWGATETVTTETNITATIPVTISSAASATVHVQVAGTALAGGTDFTLATTTIVFLAAGPTSSNLIISLVDDAVVEGPEMVRFTLTQAIGARVAGPDVSTLFIRDSDGFSIMAANLTSGTNLYPDVYGYQAEGQRLFRTLAPDVVAIQEWTVTSGTYQAFVDAHFGSDFTYYVEPESGAYNMPNGIISRWPITASNEWADTQVDNRDFSHVTIDLPGALNLQVISVHFKAGDGDFAVREAQAVALTNYIAGAGFGANDYVVIAGDLNLSNRAETALAVLTNIVTDATKPEDNDGVQESNVSGNRPYDLVLPNTKLQAQFAGSSYNGVAFNSGMIFDTRLWDDHQFPALASDSKATNLTHRPVVKVFAMGEVVDPPVSFTATAASVSQIDLAFETNAAGNNVLIVWDSDGTFTDPSGDPPALGEAFAGGTVLYYGTALATNHTGLDSCETYYYKAWSYSGTAYSSGLETNETTETPAAPTGLYADPTNTTDFTANWSASSGAASYRLDVSTNETFTGAAGGASTNCYHNGTLGEGTGGTWTETGLAQGAGYLVSMTNDVLITPVMDFTGSAAETLNFMARTYGGVVEYNNTITVSISTNNGVDWAVLGTRVPLNTTLTAMTPFDLISYNNNQVFVKLETLNASGTVGAGIDDVIITNMLSASAAYVPGFSNLTVAGTSESVTGLTSGATYYYRVRTVGDGGCVSDNSTTQSVTTLLTAPATPAGLWASDGASTNLVTVGWEDVAGEAAFVVWRNTASNFSTASAIFTNAANATNYNDTGATPGQLYYFFVVASNSGGSSAESSADTGYRKLATVGWHDASYDDYTDRITVTWTNLVGETGYSIWRNTVDVSGGASFVGVAAADAESYDDTTATPDLDYYYWVRATNDTSQSHSDLQASGALGRRAPAIPTVETLAISNNIPGSAKSGGLITDQGGSAVSLRGVCWNTGGSPTTNDATSADGSGTGSYDSTLTNLVAGETYYVRAYAVNDDGVGYGEVSNFVNECFTSAPIVQAASPIGSTTFTANWLALAGASSYRLDVSTNALFTGGTTGGALIGFDFSGYIGNEGEGTSTVAMANMESPAYITRGASITAAANADRFNASGWDGYTSGADALANGNYFEWTIQPSNGFQMSITSVTFRLQRSGTGPSNVVLRASHDSYTADLVVSNEFAETGTIIVGDLSGVAGLQGVSGAITFRLACWPGASGGSMGFEGAGNDLLIQGTLLESYSCVPGYADRTVSGTSESVTGLTAEVDYYYRVRAYGAESCYSGYSSTQSVTTTESAATWDGEGANKRWDTGENWVGDAVPGSDAVTYFYTAIGSGTNINLNGDRTVRGLRFNDDADSSLNFSNSTLTINNAGIAVASGSDGAHTIRSAIALGENQAWTNDSAQTLTLAGAISGAGNVDQYGSGRILLSGVNTFSGTLVIHEGALQARNAAALGANGGGSGTTVENGAVLEVHGGGSSFTVPEPLTLNGTGGAGGGALRFLQNNVTFSGNITLGSDARIQAATNSPTVSGDIDADGYTLYVGVDESATQLTLSGDLTGTLTTGDGAFVKDGDSRLLLSGDNSGLTGTFRFNAGEIRISGGSSPMGSTGDLIFGTNVTLKCNDSNDRAISRPVLITGNIILGEDVTRTGSLTIDGTVDLNGLGQSVAVNNPVNKYVEFQGVVSNGGLTKDGSGLLILSAANTYAGGTTVNAGTLQGTTDSLQGDFANYATLVFAQSTTGTYAGSISGSGNVNKEDGGTVVFSGTNPYAGLTRINGGTLVVNGSSDGSAHTVNAGTTLMGVGTVGELTWDGTVNPGTVTNEPNQLDAGPISLGPGGTYRWEITNATGTAGSDWDLVTASGAITLNASPDDPFVIRIWGSPPDFDPEVPQSWTIIDASGGEIVSFSAAGFTVDADQFTPAPNGGNFMLADESGDLVLYYNVPGVSVLGTNLVVITNGTDTVSLDKGTDFGEVDMGQPATRTFTVTNAGYASLTLEPVALEGANTNCFQVTSQVSGSVEAGGSTTFSVTFTPTNLAVYSATVRLTNSIVAYSPYTFALQGTGVISGPLHAEAWADGNQMVRLEWTNHPSYDVMIVSRATNAPTAPSQGVGYSVGDDIDGSGSLVFYKGSSLNEWEYIVPAGSTNHYAFYSVAAGNYYSAGTRAEVANKSYDVAAIQEPFAYTNGVTLAGLQGGYLWSNAWSVAGGAQPVTMEQFSLESAGGYPYGGGNQAVSDDLGNGEWTQAERLFLDPNKSDNLYLGWVMRVEAPGTGRYAGIELVGGADGATPLFRVGVPPGSTVAGIQRLQGGQISNSAVTIEAGADYTFIAKYVRSTETAYLLVYTTNDTILTAQVDEPAVGDWDAAFGMGAGFADDFYGLRLTAGGTNDPAVGTVRWDEIRVANNWTNVMAEGRAPVWDGEGNLLFFKDVNWVGDSNPRETNEVVVFYRSLGKSGDIHFNAAAGKFWTYLGIRFDYRADEDIYLYGSGVPAVLRFFTGGIEVQASRGSHSFNTTALEPVCDQNWTNVSTNAFTIMCPVIGTGNVTKVGSGRFHLVGPDLTSYSGTMTVAEGPLSIAGRRSLGSTNQGTIVQTGGALELRPIAGTTYDPEPLQLSNFGVDQGGALRNMFYNNNWSGPITLAGHARINADAGTLLTISGGINGNTLGRDIFFGGAGNITVSTNAIGTNVQQVIKDGAGTFTLSAVSVYAGNTLVSNATFTVSAANLMPTGTAVTVSEGATFALAGYDQTIGSLAGTGSVTLGSGLLTAGGNGQSTEYSGIMSGTGGFSKRGAGMFTVSGTNTYSGNTTVSNGTLRVRGLTAGSAHTVYLNGTLMGTGTVGDLTIYGLVDPGDTNTARATLNAGAITLGAGGSLLVDISAANGTAGTDWDLLAGSGALTCNDSGIFTIRLKGDPAGFAAASNFAWKVMSGASISGYDMENFYVDTSDFVPDLDEGEFVVTRDGNDLYVSFSTSSGFPSWDGEGTGAGSNNWDTAENWEGDTIPGVTRTVAFYLGLGSGTNINLNGNRTVRGLRITNTTTAIRFYNNRLTIGRAGLVLGEASVGAHAIASDVALGADQSWTNNSSYELSINGVLSGASALRKVGTGQVVLSANNTFRGGLYIDEGVVQVQGNTNAVGAGDIHVGTNAALVLHGNAFTWRPLETYLAGLGTATRPGALCNGQGGTVTWPGDITLNADARICSTAGTFVTYGNIAAGPYTLYITNVNTFAMRDGTLTGGKTTGDGALYKTGAGILVLQPDPDLSGSITLAQGTTRLALDLHDEGGVLTMMGGTVLQSTEIG